MERVYVVYGYDYRAKKEAPFTIDKRDITRISVGFSQEWKT